ncbi:MAG: hypothetical protein ACU0CI_03235 [Shimia sp.]
MTRLLRVLALLAPLATPLAAQEAAVPEVEVPAPEPEAPAPEPVAQTCEAEREQLVGALVTLQAACAASDAARACEDQLALQRAANVTLSREVEACAGADRAAQDAAEAEAARLTRLIEDERMVTASLQAEREAMQAALDTATAEAARLADALATAEAEGAEAAELRNAALARLAELGVGLEPAFFYLEDDPFTSFLRASDLRPGVPQLPVSECAGALDWLEAQRDRARALRLAAFGWQDGAVRICARASGGGVDVQPARAGDEAHVVVFR